MPNTLPGTAFENLFGKTLPIWLFNTNRRDIREMQRAHMSRQFVLKDMITTRSNDEKRTAESESVGLQEADRRYARKNRHNLIINSS